MEGKVSAVWDGWFSPNQTPNDPMTPADRAGRLQPTPQTRANWCQWTQHQKRRLLHEKLYTKKTTSKLSFRWWFVNIYYDIHPEKSPKNSRKPPALLHVRPMMIIIIIWSLMLFKHQTFSTNLLNLSSRKGKLSASWWDMSESTFCRALCILYDVFPHCILLSFLKLNSVLLPFTLFSPYRVCRAQRLPCFPHGF